MLAQGRVFYGWIMLVAVMLMTFSSSGARFSFGVFVSPMHEELGWGLDKLFDAAALNLLVAGLLRPVAGLLADRFGSRVVALSGLAGPSRRPGSTVAAGRRDVPSGTDRGRHP